MAEEVSASPARPAGGGASGEASIADDHVAADEETLNDPTKAEDDANPIVDAVCAWYRDHVDGADNDVLPVRVWRALANTVLKPQLAGFFIDRTEFTKRLAAFEANGKFEEPSEGRTLRGLLDGLRGEFGQSLKVYCWHTLGGYWGGVSVTSPQTAHLDPWQHQPRPTCAHTRARPPQSSPRRSRASPR